MQQNSKQRNKAKKKQCKKAKWNLQFRNKEVPECSIPYAAKQKTGKVGFEPTVSDKVHVSFQD